MVDGRYLTGRGMETPLVLSVFATAPGAEPFGSFLDSLRASPTVNLVGVGTTGRETIEAIRTNPVDALIFAKEYADLARTVRLSARLPLNGRPSLLLVAPERTDPVVVRSALYGFDGFIALEDDPSDWLRRITAVVDGSERPADEPLVRQLGIPHGLLVREFVAPGERDQQVADLVGVGLDDRAIATTMAIPVQEVRNRIEGLLAVNGLASRTHLAVIRAGHVIVPDFA